MYITSQSIRGTQSEHKQLVSTKMKPFKLGGVHYSWPILPFYWFLLLVTNPTWLKMTEWPEAVKIIEHPPQFIYCL